MASVYQDITISTVSAALSKLAQYCTSHNKKLMLCCDTNSHSTLWNCDRSNKRGEDMEEFILSHNLEVFNDGAVPTFQTKRASTIIDVTLGSSHLQDLVEN